MTRGWITGPDFPAFGRSRDGCFDTLNKVNRLTLNVRDVKTAGSNPATPTILLALSRRAVSITPNEMNMSACPARGRRLHDDL